MHRALRIRRRAPITCTAYQSLGLFGNVSRPCVHTRARAYAHAYVPMTARTHAHACAYAYTHARVRANGCIAHSDARSPARTHARTRARAHAHAHAHAHAGSVPSNANGYRCGRSDHRSDRAQFAVPGLLKKKYPAASELLRPRPITSTGAGCCLCAGLNSDKTRGSTASCL